MDTPLKQCSKCKRWLPATSDYYHRRPHRKTPWVPACKECENKGVTIPPSKLVAREGHKVCRRCLTEKPATPEYFTRRKQSADGFVSHCKDCVSKQRKEYRERNIDEIKQRKAKYYEANKERLSLERRLRYHSDIKASRQKGREYYTRNKTTKRERAKQYRLRNLETRRIRDREYYQVNRERKLRYWAQYRETQADKVRATNRRWRKRNEQYISEKGRVYRQQNRSRILKHAKVYRSANRDRIRKANQDWRRRNASKVKANHTRWRQQNRHAVNIASRRREARKKALPSTFIEENWLNALDYFAGRCAACNRPINGLFHTAHADHWVALSSPDCPGTVATNIVPLCGGQGGCNQSKKDRDPEEWLKSKFGTRKAKEILARINAYFDWVREQDGD